MTRIIVKTDGNPEGKGLSGFLLDWYRTEPRGVVIKPRRQVLAEFFTSMLVLSARFKYRPAVGVDNYLYCIDGEWLLSLIAPGQWSARHRAGRYHTRAGAGVVWDSDPGRELRETDNKSLAVRTAIASAEQTREAVVA